MPGATHDLGHSWYASTVLLFAFGFYMWPQYFAASFAARSGNILRRNAMIMPLYAITMPLMFFVGLSAVLILPRLSNPDLALLTIVRQTFPAWFLGLIGGAGALTAMVPAAIQLLTASTLFSKNLCRPILAPEMTDRQVALLAKVTVLVLTAGALFLATHTTISLVSLLILGYGGVAQFLPGVIFGLFWRRVTAFSVLAGIVAGICMVVFMTVTGRDPYLGLNAGFISVCVNLGVTSMVTLLTPVRAAGFDDILPALPASQPSDDSSFR
jgi:SSS family solute:Na+ symporter